MNELTIFKTDVSSDSVSKAERQDAENTAWEEFGRVTMEESSKQQRVREYYFESDSTEVIAKLLEIAKQRNSENINEIYETNMLAIAQRYIKSEKDMIVGRPTMSHPSPCDIFTSYSFKDNKITFFIAKIDIAQFFDTTEGRFKTGLPHSDQGKSSKNWKTATITIYVEEDEELIIEEVVVTDTAAKIADYWAKSFLEATEVTDDVKNTKDIYKEIKKIITNNGGINKTPQVIADNTHYLNQLNGYMLNNTTFTLETALDHIFGAYTPLESNCPPQNLVQNINTKFNEKGFDRTFIIVHNEIKSNLKVDYKISNNITLKIKHVENLKNTIKSELSSTGEPIIVIKVESTENKVYKSFLTAETD